MLTTKATTTFFSAVARVSSSRDVWAADQQMCGFVKQTKDDTDGIDYLYNSVLSLLLLPNVDRNSVFLRKPGSIDNACLSSRACQTRNVEATKQKSLPPIVTSINSF